MDPVYRRSVAAGAAFVPGKYFLATGGGKATMRLNFTTADPEDLSRAVGIFGGAIEAEMAAE
jgi:DNA-binding transcriptional MocR family regulator